MILMDGSITAIDEQASSDLGNEAVILNLKSGIYYGLNEVGARIWQLLQQPQTVLSIRDKILDEFEIDPETCQQDVLAILQDLKMAELIRLED